MKKLKIIGLFFLIGICCSCKQDDEINQEQEAETLNQMFSEIENLASNVSCDDSAEWTFTNFGSKPCGGPVGFIAYSTNIDIDLFLESIEEHRIKQNEFNKKWGLISDCSIPPQPIGVICEDGHPVLEY